MNENEEENGAKPEDKDKADFPTLSQIDSVEEIGTQIGHYKLLSVLGEGGFGIVYLAEQKQPVRRQVALKVIKPGMDSKQVIGRFESERQALALLDHPNIARIFDGGTTEAGRPYFVMELVKGLSITEYCDEQKLSIEDRLELFRQVCETVQHAHQKGIIHRDIKPSNILVFTQGGKALPKIIDFGIAKAVSQPLTERTIFTEQGQFIGTPEYMSPEQAGMKLQDIDTRSDIYSLGVVLYELLTGALPFTRKELEQAGRAEIQRIIRETDPPRPSTRLSSLGEEAKKIAERRHTALAALTKRLYKELEWIPLKAMRKEPDRRYKTASELGNDVQYYLNGDPLMAGPESRTYRLKKTIKRHRVGVTAVAAVVAVLFVGLIATTTMYFRSEVARAETDKQREVYRRQVYFHLISQANEELRNNRVYRASELLGKCDEDLRYWEWHYLWRICRSAGIVLHGNKKLSSNASFSVDGKYVVSGTEYGTVIIWDAETASETMALKGHDSPVISVDFSSDGERIVSCSWDNTIRLWDLATKSEIKRIPCNGVASVVFSPDGKRIISGCRNGKIIMWDGTTGSEIMQFGDYERRISLVRYSPDRERILTTGKYGELKVWNAKNGDQVLNINIDSPIFDAAFSQDSSRIVCCALKRITICDVATGKEIPGGFSTQSPVEVVAFSPDAKYVAWGDFRGMIRVRNVTSGSEEMAIGGHNGSVTSLAFDMAGRRILSCDSGGTIGVWEFPKSDAEQVRILSVGQTTVSFAYSPDRRKLFTMTDQGKLCIMDIVNYTKPKILPWDRRTAPEVLILSPGDPGIALSPDGRYLVQGSVKGTVHIFDSETSKEIWKDETNGPSITAIALSQDGKCIATGNKEGIVSIWDLAKRTKVKTFSTDQDYLNSLVFGPNGNYLVAAGMDAQTREYVIGLWDSRTGAEKWKSSYSTSNVFNWGSPITFSPDGKYVVSGNNGGVVKVWNADSGNEICECFHGGKVTSVSFDPNATRIVSGSSNGIITIWDVQTGAYVLTLDAESGVQTVFFSDDGKRIFASCEDGDIKKWDSVIDNEVADAGYWRMRGLVHYRNRDYVLAIDCLTRATEIDPEDVNSYRERARVYASAQEYDKAISDYTKAIEINPNNLSELLLRAGAYRQIKKYDLAIGDYSAAIELDPNNPILLQSRAYIYSQMGQHDKAIADCSKVIQLDPNNASHLISRALAYRQAGQNDLAIKDFTATIELDPNNSYLLRSRGDIYARMKQYADAIADFNKAIELDPEESSHLISRAQAYLQAGQNDLAIKDFNAAIELDPDNPWYLFRRGSAYSQMRKDDLGIEDYSAAIKLDPNDPWHLSRRVEAYHQAGQNDLAIKDFNTAIEFDPKNPKSLINRGYAYLETKQRDLASVDFSAAMGLDPKSLQYLTNRADGYLRTRQYDLGIAGFSAAIELDPNNASHLISRAQAYRQAGQNDLAIKDFNAAIELDPNNSGLLQSRADTYARMGQHDKAIEELSKAIEDNPNDSSLLRSRASIYSSMGQHDKAIAEFSKAIQLDPNDSSLLGSRGRTYFQMKQYSKAADDFTQVIEIYPNSVIWLDWRGSTYARMKQYAEAIADFTKAIDLNPNSSNSLWWRGSTYTNMKQYSKAVTDLSKALELDPENPGILKDRGHAYCEQGQYEDAILDFNKAIQLDPNNSNWWWWRGSSFTKMKRYAEAVADLSKAIELDPDNPGPLRDRGTAYFKSKQYKSAMSDWAKSVELDWLGRDITDGKHSATRWLAWGYATCPVDGLRNGRKAVELAREACENTNMKDAVYLDTLAAAYAEAGDFKSAVEWQQKAIDLLTDENRAEYETDFKKRLELYKSGKPYREEP